MAMTVIPGINKKSSWRAGCSLFVARIQKHLPFIEKQCPRRTSSYTRFHAQFRKEKMLQFFFNIKPLAY